MPATRSCAAIVGVAAFVAVEAEASGGLGSSESSSGGARAPDAASEAMVPAVEGLVDGRSDRTNDGVLLAS
eukprot:4261600-Prymnesium_polylepis.1